MAHQWIECHCIRKRFVTPFVWITSQTMSRPRILVTGADGQLGRSLQALSTSFQADWIFTTRTELDISDDNAIREFFKERHFDFCINTAAYTKVDLAEQESEQANLINAVAPGLLAMACHQQGCVFVHLSSDYVYDNGLTRPLKEDDPVSPTSVYARTKLEGERLAMQSNPRTLIIRTSWVFSEYGHNFVKTMARLLSSGKALSIVNDQIGCPTYASDLAEAILKIVRTIHADNRGNVFGVYNFCNDGPVTWYAFAKEIGKMLGIEPDITPVSTGEYGAPATRPLYSVLDTRKVVEMFGIEIRDWRVGLGIVLENPKV